MQIDTARRVPELSTERSALDPSDAASRPREDQVAHDVPPLAGAVAFESPEVQVQRRAELLGAGALVVQVPALSRACRGCLAEHIDERIERELAARGAPSPYLACWSSMPDDVEARLADQLFRARTVGACGMAILLGSLGALADGDVLSPEDSATVRFLARSTADRPLVVLLDDADHRLRGYEAPVAIAGWTATGEDDGPPPSVVFDARAFAADDDDGEGDREGDALGDDEEILGEVVEDEDAVAAPEPPSPVEPTPVVTREERAVVVRGEGASRSATVGVPVATTSDAWRAWALALSAARGPQALGTFERLFVDSYVPLANAIATGLDDPRALRAHEEFRRSFERAYSDASATFGLTTRRPRMVMDAFDVATKQARVHNARTAQVLVVDSLRQDIGARARESVIRRTAGAVTLTAETLLWSALPTTTIRQLETLARGVDALRGSNVDDTPMDSLRGRTAEQVRRMRVGARELYKLDVVPAMLATLTDPRNVRTSDPLAAFDEIGEAVGEAVARHLESLPPRTLLLVVGDHGFALDRRGRVTHGGASPEEVLVPAQAWLVGDVH